MSWENNIEKWMIENGSFAFHAFGPYPLLGFGRSSGIIPKLDWILDEKRKWQLIRFPKSILFSFMIFPKG